MALSVEAFQKVIATTLVIGGLGGGYFALTGGSSATLLGMHLALEREENTDWEEIANKYKVKEQNDVIEGVSKASSKLSRDIKRWCDNNKNTYYLDDTDKTYQSYSLWCLKETTIEKVLEKKKFKWLTDKWEKKLEKYKASFDQFIKDKSPQPKRIEKEKLKVTHISEWCTENRSQRYKYQGDETERRVRFFCYWSDEELEEVNKPVAVSPSN